jgi:hypothetical protein
MRLLDSSLSYSRFVFCLVLAFCAQETILPETGQQSESGPALQIPTLAVVSAPT